MATKSCIVLMPFKDEFKERFEFFQRCGKKLELDVQRVDTYAFSGNIPNAITRALAVADLVLADLSDGNANVVYEIAIAQCMGQRLVLVTNDRNKVPFDLQAYRIELFTECTQDAEISLTYAMQQAMSATYVTGPLGGKPIFGQRVFVRRTFAFAIDVLGLLLIAIILGMLFWKGSPTSASPTGKITVDEESLLFACMVFIAIMYFTISTWLLGASPGQRALDIKVVDYDGKQLGFGHAIGRSFAMYTSLLTYGVGYFWALHGPSYRTFHDILSRTMVIRCKGKPKHAPL